MQLAVEKLLKEPGSSISRVFRPKPDELNFEGVEFSKRPIRVSVELQNTGGGIVGNLDVQCELSIECGRCVERCGYAVSAVRNIEYLVNPTPEALHAEMKGWFVSQFDGETIVFDEDVRQMLLLAIPIRFLCREDCRGLCPRCGANLNSGACGCPQPGAPAVENPFRAAFNDLIRKKKL